MIQVRKMIKKLIGIYDKFEEIFLVVCIAAMVVAIFAQVVMRYVLNSSLVWSEELARILFIWASWIGISLGQKKGEHIKITMVTDRLHEKAQKAVLVIGDICTIFILIVLCVEGVKVVEHIMSIGTATPALGIPKSVVYAAVPVSCFLMAVRVIKSMWITLTRKGEKGVA